MIRKSAGLAGLAAIFLCTAAHAADGLSVELGHNHELRLWRIGVQSDWERTWSAGRTWEIGGYWDFAFGGWRNGEGTLYDVGVTPVFRLRRRAPSWPSPSPYLEAAIGFHLLSDLEISSDRIFSTKFQFGDHIGAGMRFGPRGRYDLSVRLQHLSNGGIRRPNPGVDFIQIRLSYHLR